MKKYKFNYLNCLFQTHNKLLVILFLPYYLFSMLKSLKKAKQVLKEGWNTEAINALVKTGYIKEKTSESRN